MLFFSFPKRSHWSEFTFERLKVCGRKPVESSGPAVPQGGKGGETSLYSSLLSLLCVCVDERHYHRMSAYLAFFTNDVGSTLKMIKEAIPSRNPTNNQICLISIWAPGTCCPVPFVCSRCSRWITSCSVLREAHFDIFNKHSQQCSKALLLL